MAIAVSVTIKLSTELKGWVTHNLDRGCEPAKLIESMLSQRFEPGIARGVIEAFVHARGSGAILGDTLELENVEPVYLPEPSRLAAGNILHTDSGDVPVLMRLERPRVAVLANVLGPEDCARLIALARPRLAPSTVVDPRTGENRIAEHRDSDGMFFQPNESPFVAWLDRRISQIMNVPLQHGEGLQVLRYGPGARSTPHFDFLLAGNTTNTESLARSGQRVSSLVIYLNDVAAGGETAFPKVGLAVCPRRGHAVHFEYCDSRGQVDPLSLHAGAPVLAGEKWAATKWVRQKPFVSA